MDLDVLRNVHARLMPTVTGASGYLAREDTRGRLTSREAKLGGCPATAAWYHHLLSRVCGPVGNTSPGFAVYERLTSVAHSM